MRWKTTGKHRLSVPDCSSAESPEFLNSPRANIHEFTNPLHLCSLMEVSGANRFSIAAKVSNLRIRRRFRLNIDGGVSRRVNAPDDIVVCASGEDRHLLHLHDVFQLRTHFSCFAQKFRMKEVLHRPVISESIRRQSSEDIQRCQ